MQKWEYYQERRDLKGDAWYWMDGVPVKAGEVKQRLDNLGKEGWELVSTHTREEGFPGGVSPTTSIYYLFKRPLP